MRRQRGLLWTSFFQSESIFIFDILYFLWSKRFVSEDIYEEDFLIKMDLRDEFELWYSKCDSNVFVKQLLKHVLIVEKEIFLRLHKE